MAITNGTVGCGSVLAIDKDGNLMDDGDGKITDSLAYNEQVATMFRLAGDIYGS